MDYFEGDTKIDSKKVAVIGYSRGGKAALWAAAEDQRFALCISNCSGNSGAALARRDFGETIQIINDRFPYWFCPNYKKYNGHPDNLPIDQHQLIALVAPRPIYITNATDDLWADPKGTYLALKNAEPVYDLYGLKSKLPKVQPPTGFPVINLKLGYHIRNGKHDMNLYDWKNFIDFADFHFHEN